jgi:demethylmenaquinone methyltransferase/2-methoxy-6-polyprenyl-1,4-benzoquinol methylase
MQLALLEGLPMARTGIDASRAMLQVARVKTSPDIAYVHGDASNMPFEDNAFACAGVSFALHEMEPLVSAGVVREMARVTVPGGRLFIADYARPETAWARLAMTAAGLVERGAGVRHHACFRDFMDRGGVPGLVGSLGLAAERVDRFLMGAAGLFEVHIP